MAKKTAAKKTKTVAKPSKAAGKSLPASKPKPIAKAPSKPAPKVVAKKAPAKAPAKPAPAKHAKAPDVKGVPGGKAPISKGGPGKPDHTMKPGAFAGDAAPFDPKSPLKKGITIVPSKPVKKPKPKASTASISAFAGHLIGGATPVRRPLISSGPNAPSLRPLGSQVADGEGLQKVQGKSPFGKKELERFRALLVRKKAELSGDISHLEEEALRGESGSLSNLPQHMAEQGSETYEQSLHLDLAAADRKLLKEIDDAIVRIDAGTYGICEMTGKPIKVERLEELPWARYSIEAARELERRSMRA
ncbi:MAG: TraR/DksA family transcriptional regulator [Planctomycetota bacterium]